MTTKEQLTIDKNKLSNIRQQITLAIRRYPDLRKLSGREDQLTILRRESNEKFALSQSLINKLTNIQNDIKKLSENCNSYNFSSAKQSIEKYSKDADLTMEQTEQIKDEIKHINEKMKLCLKPEYHEYCCLMKEQNRLELLINNEESRQSLLTTFCYDAKQRRLLPLNIKEELAHHLGTEWGANLMKKYADLSVSYLPDKVQVVNANNEPEISTDEKGGLCMYKRPSQNEKLADLMVEMYFKAIEDRIGKVHIHQASGPDADFMAKKIALGLQQRGYLDNRVNGQLVTDILGIKKEIEQPASAPVNAATATPPSPSSATADHHEALKQEEKSRSPATSTSSNSEPEMPEWYTKQLETDKFAENNSSPSLKMR